MVQRKPVNKVATQAESKKHVKSEKKSSSQYQDVRNKGGGDLMKKTKRARSFKLSNSESLGSRKEHLRPNKISGDVSISTTPLRNPSPIKKSDGSSPNYMKATSSSDARRERLQVSPTSQIADKSRSPKELCVLKPSSSGHKSIKILRKNSSLKPVRPSMKISGITLYPKPNVDRATCSSTLKDSKFPPYVDLNPGGTQLEGTSVVKVCPYTYCSLNGHHHKPSPPLRRFLSARRRFLRAQKSMNFKGMSTPKMKDLGANKEEIDADQIKFNKYMISLQADSEDSEISPLIEDECTDFFIKIYAKPREEIVEIEQNSHFDPSVKDFDEISLSENDDIACEYSQPNEIEMEEDSRVAEGQLDETHLETSLEDNLDESDNSESESNGLVNTEFDNGDKQFEAHDTEMDFKCYQESVLDGENLMDESDSEGSEMYWEEHLSSCEDVYGTDLSQIFDDEYDQDTMSSQKNEHAGVHNEVAVVPKNAEILEEVFDEDTESNSSGCDEGDSNFFVATDQDDGEQSSEVEVSGEGIGETAEQQEEAGEKNEETKEDKDLLSENAFLGNHDELTDGIPVAFIVLVEEQENNPPQDDLIKNCGVLPEEQSSDEDNDTHLMLDEDDAEAIVGLFEDAKSLHQVQISGSNCLYESNEDITDEEPRPHQTHMETEVQQSDAVTDENTIDLNSACIGETAEEQDEACAKNGEIKQDKDFLPENAFLDNLDELTDGSSAAFEVLVEEQEDDLVRDVLAEDQSSDEDNDAQVMPEEIEDEAIVDLCEDSNSLSQVQISGSNDWSESDEDIPNKDPRPDETHMKTEVRESDGITDENVIDLNSSILDQDAPGIDEHVSGNQPVTDCIIKEQQDSVKDHTEVGSITPSSISDEESSYSQRNKSSSPGECSKEDETVKTEVSITSQEEDKAIISMELDFGQPLPEAHINANKFNKRMGRRVMEEDKDHLKKFNPRAPRFLTLEPEPDPENVDLRHQMMDEKKDAEEWMLDFALRRVVSKLGPSRKKRVSLLVEAFETVMPIAKYETPVSFAHARTIQACN